VGPLLVVIDDLPWLDRESTDALVFAPAGCGTTGSPSC
jgi:hypothetical protein